MSNRPQTMPAIPRQRPGGLGEVQTPLAGLRGGAPGLPCTRVKELKGVGLREIPSWLCPF